MRILIDRVLELQESAVITFLDLTNAFGSVSEKFLDAALGDAVITLNTAAVPLPVITPNKDVVRITSDHTQ